MDSAAFVIYLTKGRADGFRGDFFLPGFFAAFFW
jgi:hypothetical protein